MTEHEDVLEHEVGAVDVIDDDLLMDEAEDEHLISSSICEDSSDAEFRADRLLRESTLDDDVVLEDTVNEDEDDDLEAVAGGSEVATPVGDSSFFPNDDIDNDDQMRMSSNVSCEFMSFTADLTHFYVFRILF